MHWEEFRLRFRIFRTLVRRFFTPWDRFFFNSIVFDIWRLACDADILGEVADRAPAMVNGDHEDLLLDDDELGDAELVSTLAQAKNGASRSRATGANFLNSQTRVNKVKFTPRSVSALFGRLFYCLHF